MDVVWPPVIGSRQHNPEIHATDSRLIQTVSIVNKLFLRPHKHRPRLMRILWVCALLNHCVYAFRAEAGSLASGFENPPLSARPLVYWHWINGNVTKEGIRADLEDMKRVGIGGAQMFDVSMYLPPGPVRYGSEAWHDDVQYAIQTASELGLEFYVMNCSGWSASGGPWVTPELSMKQLVWDEVDVAGGHESSETLAAPPRLLGFYRDIAVLAVPCRNGTHAGTRRQSAASINSLVAVSLATNGLVIAPDQVIDLTKNLSDKGVVHFNLPAGDWTIIRFGYTSTARKNHPATAAGEGLEIDKLDADAVKFQFDHALGKIISEAGPLAGKAFAGIHIDSFEAGFQNWTETFPAQFQQLKGYDLIPCLPVLTGRVMGSRGQSEAIVRDFQNAVAEILARKYFGTMQRLAHEHGLKLSAETYGGPLNPFLCNGQVDLPMAEFWLPGSAVDESFLKNIAATANLNGRSLVASEAFTSKPESARWLPIPATLKPVGDHAFTTGINRFVLHSYVHQPYADIAPGFTLGRYGTHFGRLNSWWPYAGAWIDYLSRCQFLLQQGRPVQDICYLVDENNGYFSPSKMAVTPRGYDYGFCDTHHLSGMVWTNGIFQLPDGLDYRVLVLPDKWMADISTLRLLRDDVESGAVVLGPPPLAPVGFLDLRDRLGEWHDLVSRLWDSKRARFIRKDYELGTVLKSRDIPPDFEYTADRPDANIRFLHRRSDEGDVYFLSNQSTNSVVLQAAFRASKRAPELWDAVTGRIADATLFQTNGVYTSLPIQLDSYGSVFLVFQKPLPINWVTGLGHGTNDLANHVGVEAGADDWFLGSAGQIYSARFADGNRQKISTHEAPPQKSILGPWEVHFQAGRGAPEKAVFDELSPWNENSNSGIRYFSGIATYTTTFDLAGAGDVANSNLCSLLDLGRVCDVAQVKVNGQIAGVLWTPPFEFDISRYLHPGQNTLEVKVANRWVNRLIGDEYLPPDASYALDGTEFTSGRLSELPGWLNQPDKISKRKRIAFATWHQFDQKSPLMDSGLLGPVELQFHPVVHLAPLRGAAQQVSNKSM